MEQWQTFKKTSHATWEVSTLGNIKKNGKPYTPYEKGGHSGTRYLTLSTNDPYGGYIHRVVANTFIPNPEGLPTVDHIDGNKQNNCVDNLRWVDYSTQLCAAIDNGLTQHFCKDWDGKEPYKQYLNRRRQLVLELYSNGKSVREISKELGYNYFVVYNDVYMIRSENENNEKG